MRYISCLLYVLIICLGACIKPETQPSGASITTNVNPDTVAIYVLRNDSFLVTGTGIADSSTYTAIVAVTINSNILLNASNITFTTTKGVFSNGKDTFTTNLVLIDTFNTAPNIIANTRPIARAFLKDNISEQAIVTASVSNIISYVSPAYVNFSLAYPEVLSVIVGNSSELDTVTSYTNVTAKLIRDTGYVSAGQVVFLHDSSSLGINSVGIFLNNTIAVGASDSVITQYWVTDSTFHGQYVYIIGKVAINNGIDSARGINKIVTIQVGVF